MEKQDKKILLFTICLVTTILLCYVVMQSLLCQENQSTKFFFNNYNRRFINTLIFCLIFQDFFHLALKYLPHNKFTVDRYITKQFFIPTRIFVDIFFEMTTISLAFSISLVKSLKATVML